MKYKIIIFISLISLKIYGGSHIFNYLTLENGLGHTDATCFSQDSIGIMWIGTNNGLHMYDGYMLKRYDYYEKKQQKIYRLHNRIQSMVQVGANLWLGTKSGLVCFNTVSRKFVDYTTERLNKEILNGDIVSLMSDNKGYLWIKTQSAIYTAKVIGRTLNFIEWEDNHQRQKYGFYGYGIQMSSNTDFVWIKEGDILVCLDLSENIIKLKKAYSLEKFIDEEVSSFYITDNFLYLRTGGSCSRFNIENDGITISSKYKKSIDFSNIDGFSLSKTSGLFLVDNEETLYNSYYGGIFSIKKPFSESPSIEFFNIGDGIEGTIVKDIKIDNFNNLWVATMNWGVRYCSLSPSLFQSFSLEDIHNKDVSELSIVAVEEDSKNRLWICTEGGTLIYYDIKKQISYIKHKFPKGFKCQVLKKSNDGNWLYIGSVKGLYKYHIQKDKLIKLFDIYSITGIKEFENGRLYISTFGDGFLIAKEHIIANNIHKLEIVNQYSDKTHIKLSSNYILSFVINTKQDEIFCATEEGLDRLLIKGDSIFRIINYTTSNSNLQSMTSNYIASVEIENDSVIWTGTIGGGVNRIHLLSDSENTYRAEAYTTNNMLPYNDAEIIYIDKEKKLWIGSHNICCIDRKKKSIVSFVHADGLLRQPFKVGAGCKMKDGTICMGGLLGLNIFKPENISYLNRYNKSRLMFTRIELSSGNWDNGVNSYSEIPFPKNNKLKLSYKDNNFNIYFAPSGFRISDNIVYRYRIKGITDDWKILSYKHNNIPFINFPDGQYKLEICMSEDSGKTWDKENYKVLDIDILSPWWRTWYIKVLYTIVALLLFLLITYLIIKSIKLKKENIIQKIEKKHAEELYNTKQRFFVNISHEFKTPLTLISLAAEHISNTTPGYECDCIMKNTAYMTSLISELMDLRKGELGLMNYTYVHDDVVSVIKNMIDEISPWINEKNQSLEVSIMKERIDMDFNKKAIKKILLNLLSNAIKYTDKGKKISIKVTTNNIKMPEPLFKEHYTEGQFLKDKEYCIFTIKDEGIGITKDSMVDIYNRFFQVNETQSKHLGSGIGLAIVKTSVLAHNGVITVSSEKGFGTEFIVALPLKQDECKIVQEQENLINNEFIVEPHDKQIIRNNDEQTNKESDDMKKTDMPFVLLVEDNMELITFMKLQLSGNYNIITAANGREGIEKVMDFYPDIIISDVMMPEMDGIEMCRMIRSNLSLAYIPIILLTAKSEAEHQIEGYEAGADIYMPKPFSTKVLESAIQHLLNLKYRNLSKEKIECTNDEQIYSNEEKRDFLIKKDHQEFLEKLYDIVNNNLHDSDLSIDFLANSMNMSRSKLYSYVKESTDITLSEYIRNRRLDKAAHLLQTTTMNITEIMYETGFINRSHFSKLFKQKFGVSPTNYIK